MAHVTSTRALGFLTFQRCCRNKLFALSARINPVVIRELPRKLSCAIPCIVHSRPVYNFVLQCSLSSSSSDEPVILSSKECSDGSILFTFGDPKLKAQENIESSNKIELQDVENPEATVLSNDNVAVEDVETAKEIKEPAKEIKESTVSEDTKLETQLDSSSQEDTVPVPENDLEKENSAVLKPDGKLRLRSGGAMRPHPDKVSTGGEDAYVIQGMWAGVADGVGGWALSGVDSGLYSRELMANCGRFASMENGIPNPKSIIIRSVKETKAIGTCTAVLAALHNQTLYVANVGDSGFIVMRNGSVLAKSKPMQRGFNFPYQIGSEGDDPSISETFEVPVTSGDVLILATDGVYDNLYEREIVDVVVSGQKKGVEPNIVATWLVKLAHQAGLNAVGRSPFSDAAQAAGYAYEGGKLDDATVVIAYIE